MARKHQAEQLLRQGFSPAQIAAEMGISVASVLGYLRTRIGEGSLKLSDLFFAIPKESRQMFEGALTERNGRKTVQWRKLPKGSYSRDELDLYLELKDASHFRGDLYQYIAEIETTLHELIRRVLILHHGQKEWWRIAIPVPIRTKCATRREEDDDPIDDNFVYTTLIELKEILNRIGASSKMSFLNDGLAGSRNS